MPKKIKYKNDQVEENLIELEEELTMNANLWQYKSDSEQLRIQKDRIQKELDDARISEAKFAKEAVKKLKQDAENLNKLKEELSGKSKKISKEQLNTLLTFIGDNILDHGYDINSTTKEEPNKECFTADFKNFKKANFIDLLGIPSYYNNFGDFEIEHYFDTNKENHQWQVDKSEKLCSISVDWKDEFGKSKKIKKNKNSSANNN